MTERPKVPGRPPGSLTHTDDDLRPFHEYLWRIHRVRGPHVLPWNAFRTFGPLPPARYDLHVEPASDQPGRGVTYAATTVLTAVAETFQNSRTVSPSDSQQLTAWEPSRTLRLLDLTGDWALRNGAAHALASAPRPVCRAWSRAILGAWPDLDGLWAPSTVTGAPICVLYEPSADSFPVAPRLSVPLSNDIARALVTDAARQIGYLVNEFSS